jgi:type II secretory pathway component GspD/PulD (secretin)
MTMDKRLGLAVALVLASGVSAAAEGSGSGSSTTTTSSTLLAKWEYRAVKRSQVLELGKGDLTAGLNKLGEEGWELVSAQQPSSSDRGPGRTTGSTEFYFKRPMTKSTTGPSASSGVQKSFPLNHLKAASAVKALQELMGKGPEIVAEPITNKVLVKGTEKEVATVEQLLKKLDVPAARPKTLVVPLKGLQAVEIAKILDAMPGKKVHIAAAPSANALLIEGSAEDVDEVIKLIQQLEAPTEKDAFKVFTLKHATATATAKVLKEFFGTKKNLRIVADERTNRVLFEGPTEEMFRVAELLKELDVPVEKK